MSKTFPRPRKEHVHHASVCEVRNILSEAQAATRSKIVELLTEAY